MNTFMEQLEIHVSSEIRHCYQTDGNLDELLTGAEARINVKAGEIESLLRTKRNHGKTPAQYWKDFVEAEFFNVAQRIRKEVESREETTEEAEDTSAQKQEEQQIRTFSASLLPPLRSDLPADIQDTFLKTIEEAVVSANDYIASYSVQLDNDEIILQHKVGVSIQDIIPESFCCQSDITHFSPPIDRSCFTDNALKKEFNSLFNPSHLQVIHASYFGTQGVTEETLKKHPFQTALRQALNEDGRRNESIDPVVMKLALNRYISNFKNMWS
ncbi:hypothetical protein RMATCC62417_05326 [Rhizopus microsporus]|nr:hypothetical protein RMATCC62417_05326 [Rhizopus microsporus]